MGRDGAALAVIKVEQIVAAPLEPDLAHLVGEIEDVMQPEIHAHAAKRIVDVRGIADQEGTPHSESRSDALMHPI